MNYLEKRQQEHKGGQFIQEEWKVKPRIKHGVRSYGEKKSRKDDVLLHPCKDLSNWEAYL